MLRKVSRLALMACALGSGLVVGTPADADGWWGRGSIKDRAAVPVPAPVPIPDYAARWYLRADLGVGFANADPSENGIMYGRDLYLYQDKSHPFGTPASWSNDDAEAVLNYGAGVGYYWSPRFRTDITLEGRSERKLEIRGSYAYQRENYNQAEQKWEYINSATAGETNDSANLNSGLFLFNAYFDLTNSGPLTPYIGAGVGFAMNKLERSFSNVEQRCSIVAPLVCTAPNETRVRDSSYDVTFAAAVMAGLSYSITPVTMLDLNYRYLYIGSSDINLNINGVKSNFSTGDTHEHQVRLGLRWNIQ
jgi:opacity protein-like surface antigen